MLYRITSLGCPRHVRLSPFIELESKIEQLGSVLGTRFSTASNSNDSQVQVKTEDNARPYMLRPFGSGRIPYMMNQMQREMDELTRDFFGRDAWRGFERLNYSPQMKADVEETDKNYIVKADIPGIAKEDVKVKVSSDGVLGISAERKHEASSSSDGSRNTERYYGKFERNFLLPKQANPEDITASVENGVLTINIAKKVGQESGDRDIPLA